jgi:hypothetical protein
MYLKFSVNYYSYVDKATVEYYRVDGCLIYLVQNL